MCFVFRDEIHSNAAYNSSSVGVGVVVVSVVGVVNLITG